MKGSTLALLVGLVNSLEVGETKDIKIVETNDKKLGFSIFGDWGTFDCNKNKNVKVLDAESKRINSEFTMLIGDNFYENGLTYPMNEKKLNLVLEKPFGKTKFLKSSDLYAIMGNHDWRGNVTQQLFLEPKHKLKWQAPELYFSNVYRFGKGSKKTTVLFVYLDTNLYVDRVVDPENHDENLERHQRWLERTLAAGSKFADYIFVTGHHAVYSIGWHGNSRELERLVRPLLIKYGVDAYIAGHDHVAQLLVDAGSDLVHFPSPEEPPTLQTDAYVMPYSSMADGDNRVVSYEDYLTAVYGTPNAQEGVPPKTGPMTLRSRRLLEAMKSRAMAKLSAEGKLFPVEGIEKLVGKKCEQPTVGGWQEDEEEEDSEAAHMSSSDVVMRSAPSKEEEDEILVDGDIDVSAQEASESGDETLPAEWPYTAENLELFKALLPAADVASLTQLDGAAEGVVLGDKKKGKEGVDMTAALSKADNKFRRRLEDPNVRATVFLGVGSGGKRDILDIKPSKELLFSAHKYGVGAMEVTAEGMTFTLSNNEGEGLYKFSRDRHPLRECIKQRGGLPIRGSGATPDEIESVQDFCAKVDLDKRTHMSKKEIVKLAVKVEGNGIKWSRPQIKPVDIAGEAEEIPSELEEQEEQEEEVFRF